MKLTSSDIAYIHRLVETGFSNASIMCSIFYQGNNPTSEELQMFRLDIFNEIFKRKQELRAIAPFFLKELKAIKRKLDKPKDAGDGFLEFNKAEVQKKINHWTELLNFL